MSFLSVGLAGAQQPPRQAASFTFNTERPGRSTGLELAIDYVNPDDAGAKPYAVQTVVEKLAPGSRINTSVPDRCRASDSELTSQGAAACPAASRVGGGRVVLDTGIEGPNRTLELNVAQFNNKDELILVFDAADGSGLRSVSRAPIENATITASAPPLPGGPPDGFTALKTVRLALGQGGYITTPPRCPADGTWEHEFTFTYRDGETQTVTSGSPCKAGPAPQIRIRGVPERCFAKRFEAHVRIRTHSGSPLRRARARLDGDVVRTTKRRRFDVAVSNSALRESERHTLSVVARDEAGQQAVKSLRFRGCTL